MTNELADTNQRTHDLDAVIKEPVRRLAPNLLAITRINHTSAAPLIAKSVTSHHFHFNQTGQLHWLRSDHTLG